MTIPQPHPGTLLIGLTGLAGAGKSTVAGYLEDRWAFEQIACADPIVDMLFALLEHVGAPHGYITERELKEQPIPGLGVSYRRLAQTLGTEWGRWTLDADFWTRIAAHRAAQLRHEGDHVVISDVRFGNEASMVRRLGGVVVRVDRQQPSTAANPRHASETEQWRIEPDHVLLNHGSVVTLQQQVDDLVMRLRGAEA